VLSFSSSFNSSSLHHQLIGLTYLHGCDIITLVRRPAANGNSHKWLGWGTGVQSREGLVPLDLVTLYQQDQARQLTAPPIDPSDAELLALQEAIAPDSRSDSISKDSKVNAESRNRESDGTTDSNRHFTHTASGKTRRAMGEWDHRLNRFNSVMPMLLSDPVEAYMEQIDIFPPTRSAVRAVCDSCEPYTFKGYRMEVQSCLEPLLEPYGADALEDFLKIYLSEFEP
jgi:hypothetical protein